MVFGRVLKLPNRGSFKENVVHPCTPIVDHASRYCCDLTCYLAGCVHDDVAQQPDLLKTYFSIYGLRCEWRFLCYTDCRPLQFLGRLPQTLDILHFTRLIPFFCFFLRFNRLDRSSRVGRGRVTRPDLIRPERDFQKPSDPARPAR